MSRSESMRAAVKEEELLDKLLDKTGNEGEWLTVSLVGYVRAMRSSIGAVSGSGGSGVVMVTRKSVFNFVDYSAHDCYVGSNIGFEMVFVVVYV